MIGVGISAGLTGAKRARSIQDPLPALDLDWATDRSLPAAYGPTPSFSRASTATYFTSSGVLSSAAINAPRFNHVYNGSSWVSKGLLVEEQRTNVVLYSADFTSGWTSSNVGMSTVAGTAPDGTSTAVKLYPTASTTQTRIYRSPGSSTCISVFAKAAEKSIVYFYDLTGVNVCYFNLSTGAIGTNSTVLTASIINCGSGWFRCSLSSSSAFSFFQIGVSDANGSTSSTASGTNGILIWGAQAEIGSFPTSYIPTTTAAVTRSADVCQITGTDFSGFWNGSEGSFAVEFDRLAAVDAGWSGGYPRTVSVRNSSDDTRVINIFGSQSPAGEAFYVQDGTLQAWFSAGTFVAANTTGKFSAAYKINDFAATLNGAAVATDTSGVIPATLNMMTIGNETGVVRYINGHIARLRYFNTRLTNSKLQEFST
jgi:hypothetical protein